MTANKANVVFDLLAVQNSLRENFICTIRSTRKERDKASCKLCAEIVTGKKPIFARGVKSDSIERRSDHL